MNRIRQRRWPATAAVGLLIFVGVACGKAPYEEGRELGRQHVTRVEDGRMSFERWRTDLERYEDKYDDEAKWAKFKDGYAREIRPVQPKIAEMVVEHTGRTVGRAAGELMKAFGKGMGEMMKGRAKAWAR